MANSINKWSYCTLRKMTLAQYLHSDSSSSPDENIIDALEQVSPLIDSNDAEQVDLFSEIRVSPKSEKAPLKLIKLLTILIKARINEQTTKVNRNSINTNRLISYLQSHVALLQALAHNSELATLFLVGQNGNQSFTDLQKSALLEQASRTSSFISKLEHKDIPTYLMKYQKFFEDVKSLPEKIKEIKTLKKIIKKANDITDLRAASETSIAILETVVLFNDILIQNREKSFKNMQSKNEEASLYTQNHDKKKIFREEENLREKKAEEKIVKYKKKIESLKKQIKNMETLNESSEELKKENESLQKENKILSSKIKESSSKNTEISNAFEELKEQKNQLLDQISNFKTKLLIDDNSSNMIKKLKDKLNKIEEENRRMRKLLDEANLNNQEMNNQLYNNNNDLKKDLSSQQHENNLLKKQISQMQEQIHNYQENGVQKDQRIERMSDKITTLNSQVLDLTKSKNRLQERISDLERMYNDATQQIDQADKTGTNLHSQISKLKKELKTKISENEELKAMLDRATSDAQKQIADNNILIKQLRRSEIVVQNKNTDKTKITTIALPFDQQQENSNHTIARLKEKLKSAYAFIKKLQVQIEKYKNKVKSENHYDEYKVQKSSKYVLSDDEDYYGTEIISNKNTIKSYISDGDEAANDNISCHSNHTENYKLYYHDKLFPYSSLDSKLNDLNNTIYQLEKTVYKSRKQVNSM